jgi:hypothetical protein
MENTIDLNRMGLQEMDTLEMSQTDGGMAVVIALVAISFAAGYLAGRQHSCPAQ